MAKGPEAFRTISEAAAELGVAQHVLRFWETKFAFVRPMKRAGGRRFYRPGDIATLAAVHRLLHSEGYTIKGVQKLHRERRLKGVALGGAEAPSPANGEAAAPVEHASLEDSLLALEAAKRRLDAVLAAR